MQSAHPVQNPFALLLNPAGVLAEIERSGRLSRLTSRICRPLDKPTPGAPAEEASTLDELARLVTASAEIS